MNQFLDQNAQTQIKDLFQQMDKPITIVLFTKEEPCLTCVETKQLLEEVSALSDKITLVTKDLYEDIEEATKYDITLTPSFVFLDENQNYTGVKFNGIPAGHEINSLIGGILEVSVMKFDFSKETIDQIKKIDKPVNIKVFVTLSCPHCPGAVQNAHRLAMINKNIVGEMIEAQTFGELSQKYNVSGVPKIVINEKYELLGNHPIEAFLAEINKI
ncbi:MAG: thioredoxin family protein [Acholeplasmataceae bacterium]